MGDLKVFNGWGADHNNLHIAAGIGLLFCQALQNGVSRVRLLGDLSLTRFPVENDEEVFHSLPSLSWFERIQAPLQLPQLRYQL